MVGHRHSNAPSHRMHLRVKEGRVLKNTSGLVQKTRCSLRLRFYRGCPLAANAIAQRIFLWLAVKLISGVIRRAPLPPSPSPSTERSTGASPVFEFRCGSPFPLRIPVPRTLDGCFARV